MPVPIKEAELDNPKNSHKPTGWPNKKWQHLYFNANVLTTSVSKLNGIRCRPYFCGIISLMLSQFGLSVTFLIAVAPRRENTGQLIEAFVKK